MAKKRNPSPPTDLLPEYLDADLGDQRRSERLLKVAAAAARDPSVSLRQSAENDAGLEGTYRLLNNPAVDAEDIFGPHQRQSWRRAASHQSVLAVHDTTDLTFRGEARKDLGRLRKKNGSRGFFVHTSLLVAEDAPRTPLGVVRFETVVRGDEPQGKKSHRAYREDPFHEGRRWLEGVRDVQADVPSAVECVHVADREADSYELWSFAAEHDCKLVVRMCSDRATSERAGRTQAHVSVRETLAAREFVLEREVVLARRSVRRTPAAVKSHPPRETRPARLGIRAQPVELLRPTSASTALPSKLRLHAVQVSEIDAPQGQPAVEWTLLTTLEIASHAEIERVVDIYRTRWLIEEYFKALKTGCAIEKRQHETLHALRNVLALFLPVAWRMLALRTLARIDSTVSATAALTLTQLEVLLALSNKPLPPSPTVTDAMWAVASLAGHFHRRKRPGWQTLAYGFEKLLFAELVWRTAREQAKM
jgi:hypothetical protein